MTHTPPDFGLDCDEGTSDQIEAVWQAITRLEEQLARIRTDLDDLRYNEVHNVKLESWQLENRVSEVERGLQSVERVCR